MSQQIRPFLIRRSFRLTFVGICLGVAMVAGILFYAALVRSDIAKADTAPGDSITTRGKNVYYTIAQSRHTSATSTRLAVYYDNAPTATNQIRILAPDDGGSNRCSGDMRINVYVGGYNDANRRLFNTPACTGGYGTSFSAAGRATYDSNVGKYKVLFEVRRHSSGDRTYFRFRIDANGGSVRSVAGGVMSYETTYPAGSPTYGDYSLNFGSDCTISSATRRVIRISDPDNYPADTSSAQRGKAFYVSVREASRNGSFYDIPGHRYGDFVNTTPEGNRLKPMVNNAEASFTLDMHPGRRYKLLITSLDHNNTIQVILPTDEIYHDVPCQWWQDASTSRTGVNLSSPGRWDKYADSGQVTAAGQRVYFAHQVEKLVQNSSAILNVRTERYWTTGPASVPSSRDIISGSNMLFTATSASFMYSLPSPQSPVTISSADFNRPQTYLCERIAIRPIGHQQGGINSWGYSSPACVQLRRSYNVVPSVTLGASSIEEGATSVPSVSATLTKSGATATDPGIYFLSRFIMRTGQTAPTGVRTTTIPYMGGTSNLVSDWRCYIPTTPSLGINGTECDDVASNGTPTPLTANTTSVFNESDDISSIPGGLNIGDRVCYVLGLTRYNRTPRDAGPRASNDFRYSAPVCATVAKSPKVQFWGADVRTGREVSTRVSRFNSSMYGSWAEYGIMSQLAVNSASGAMLSSGADGRPSTDDQGLNPLTFANSGGVGGVYGNYGMVPPTNLTASFTDTSTGSLISGTVDLSSLDSGEYRATGSLQLFGNVSSGKHIIIKATGAVDITGNITYDNGPYSSLSAVPQLVISARSIAINESVNEINGWMIANRASGSYVSTCGAVASAATWTSGLSSTACNQQLRVNGVIVTNHLYLRRTFGAEKASRHVPAETLNLRPDVYLWSSSESNESGAISTMKIRELPPRY